jgi:hypothetical protein
MSNPSILRGKRSRGHGFAEDGVYPGLIAFAAAFKPGQYIGVQFNVDILFDGFIQGWIVPSFKSGKIRDSRGVGIVDLAVGNTVRPVPEFHPVFFAYLG